MAILPIVKSRLQSLSTSILYIAYRLMAKIGPDCSPVKVRINPPVQINPLLIFVGCGGPCGVRQPVRHFNDLLTMRSIFAWMIRALGQTPMELVGQRII